MRRAREQAEAKRAAAEKRAQEKAETKRHRALLDAVIARGESVWQHIEAEIGSRKPAGYDTAASLLADLRVIAEEGGTAVDYARRLRAIRDRHAGKWRFIERLKGLA